MHGPACRELLLTNNAFMMSIRADHTSVPYQSWHVQALQHICSDANCIAQRERWQSPPTVLCHLHLSNYLVKPHFTENWLDFDVNKNWRCYVLLNYINISEYFHMDGEKKRLLVWWSICPRIPQDHTTRLNWRRQPTLICLIKAPPHLYVLKEVAAEEPGP